MNISVVSIAVQEGMKLLAEVIRTRTIKLKEVSGEVTKLPPEEVTEERTGEKPKAKVEGVACIPCVNSHFSTCAGLISDEALRMARRHGIKDEEISRINKCIDQLNAMEREDLAVDKISDLEQWEKHLALYAQKEGASIRHDLEHLTTVDELENTSLRIIKAREYIGRSWFEQRLEKITPQEIEEIQEKVATKLEDISTGGSDE